MNRQKAAIIGCGFVGSSTAFALMQKGLFSELVLIDADQKKAHGEAADIAHGRPFAHMMQIYAGDYGKKQIWRCWRLSAPEGKHFSAAVASKTGMQIIQMNDHIVRFFNCERMLRLFQTFIRIVGKIQSERRFHLA